MAAANSNQGGKKGGMKTVGIVALVAVILVMAGVIVYLLISRRPAEEERRNVVVTPENVDEVIEEMENREERTPTGYYTVTMNYDWHFETGDAVSDDAYVENAEMNTNPVYFDLFLNDDRENAIYKSPVIPVGSSLQDIALDTDLDAGAYDCVCVYHLVDDEQNTLNTLRVTVTVTVER